MMSNPAVLLFVAVGSLLSVANAHLSSVCSMTHPSRPGEVTFIFSTYHGTPAAGGSVPGTAYIKTPTGITSTFSFNQFCAFSYYSGASTLDSDEFLERSLTQDCFCDSVWGCGTYDSGSQSCTSTDSGCPAINTSLTHVECYGAADGVSTSSSPYWGGIKDRSEKHNCYFDSSSLLTSYYATVTNVQSGTFEIWATGMDINLATSSSYPIPCNMESDRHILLPVTVADGGPECSDDPTAVDDADCTGPAMSGTVCGAACPSGLVPASAFQCSNGDWDDSVDCVDPDNACSPDDIQAIDANAAGLSGDGCGFVVSNGTNCTSVCDDTRTSVTESNYVVVGNYKKLLAFVGHDAATSALWCMTDMADMMCPKATAWHCE